MLKIFSVLQKIHEIGFGVLILKIFYDLRVSTSRSTIGPPSHDVDCYFKKIRNIPGAFNLDDMQHFLMVSKMQTMNSVRGDLLEIGTYHGRSASLMSLCLNKDEQLHLCDAFLGDTEDFYINKPTVKNLIRNISSVNPTISLDNIIVHNMLSNELIFDKDQEFRLVHVDGGHSDEQTYFDMRLAATHLCVNGIIIVDDYMHNAWKGVRLGVDRFLTDFPDYYVLFDLNRHGALGRKVYISKKLDSKK